MKTRIICISAYQWCPWNEGMVFFFSKTRDWYDREVFKLYDALGLLVVMDGAREVELAGCKH